MIIVPCNYLRESLSVLASKKVYSDLLARHHLPVADLRSDIVAVLYVLQLVVIVRRTVAVVILREFPKRGIDRAAYPLYFVASVITRDKGPVIVHCEKFISLFRIVPDTCVDNDLRLFALTFHHLVINIVLI